MKKKKIPFLGTPYEGKARFNMLMGQNKFRIGILREMKYKFNFMRQREREHIPYPAIQVVVIVHLRKAVHLQYCFIVCQLMGPFIICKCRIGMGQ